MNEVGKYIVSGCLCWKYACVPLLKTKRKEKSNVNSNLYDKYWEIIINYNHAIMVCSKVF